MKILVTGGAGFIGTNLCNELRARGYGVVGWDLPLDSPEMFREVLQKFVDMEQEEHVKWSEKVRGGYGLQVTKDDKVVEQNRQLFLSCCGHYDNHSQEKTNV